LNQPKDQSMKNLLLVLFCTFSLLTIGQELSTFPELPMTDFYAFDVDGDRIVAIGRCDQIWFTKDGGTNWSYQEVPDLLFDVKFIPNDPEGKAIVVGKGVFIFDFEDGFIQDFNDDPLFYESNFYRNLEVNNDEIFVLGPEQVVRSSPSDFVWEEIYRDTFAEDYIYTSALFGNQMILGGREGRLVKLNIENQEWELMQQFDNWIQDISMGSENVGYMVASGVSEVLKTSDGWSTYVALDELPESINPIAFGEDVIITVNTNRIYLSTDGGQSSSYIQTANTPEFSLTNSALFTDNGDLYFAGRGAMMTKSEDYGMSWIPLNPYNRSNLYAVDADDNGNIVVTGENQTYYSSSDYGESWTEKSIDVATDEYWSNAIILGPNRVLITSGDYLMILENDEIVFSDEINVQEIIHNNEMNYLIAMLRVDNIYEVYKSTDEGATWTKYLEFDDYAPILDQSPSGKIFAGNSDQIYSSIDHGETWTEEFYDLEQIRRLKFWDDELGLVAAGNKLNLTTDGGQTFEEISGGYAINNIHFISKDTFFFTTASSNSTNLRMTEDGGETFYTFYSNCATTYASVVNEKNELILAQRDGHIQVIPFEEEVIPSAISNLESLITINVFPNPKNKYEPLSIEGEWDELTIFNIEGHLVYRQDFYSEQVAIPNMQSGVYFVRMVGEQKNGIGKLIVE